MAWYEDNKPVYQQSQDLIDAMNKLKETEAQKPGEYQSQYGDKIQQTLDNILNRKSFSYDMNADALYNQYKDMYSKNAKAGMMDTMANAASLTGGYGSSYATTAGNQAYSDVMSGLNNVVPQLYSIAMDKYKMEGDTLNQNLGTLQGLDQADYGKYRDKVSDWRNDLTYYYTKGNDMSQKEYNYYLNNLDAWENDRNYYYGKDKDTQAMEYQKQQDAQAQANWQKEYALSVASQKTSSAKSAATSRKSALDDYSSRAWSMVNKGNHDGAIDYLQGLWQAGQIDENELMSLGIDSGLTPDQITYRINQNAYNSKQKASGNVQPYMMTGGKPDPSYYDYLSR